MPEGRESERERDLVLTPNEFAFISDQTKGNINVYVGPYKTSLANTDKPVIFDETTKGFERCTLDQSIQTFTTAPEGWYVVMKNPAKDGNQPKTGTSNVLPELNIGRKVNIPGPVSFALWSGQMVRVLRGHNLRSNQYLLVRVYDEDGARENWAKAVIKTKAGGEGEEPEIGTAGDIPELTMGKTLVIKGNSVSFYIPPTGVEVVRDEENNYVREAATLERLEYCILLDEDGNKRYIQGPAVVFPEPTEEFVYKNGMRKFKAVELNELSGIYIKVIAPYEEEGKSYKEGDEIFLTGKDTMIYYPRPEHAIIKYGNRERHYAIAIPAGEGRYYLNRKTGKVSLKEGPVMFLPDPREAVFVRRVLSPDKVGLWFPGNQEALDYNKDLESLSKESSRAEGEDVEGALSPAAPAAAGFKAQRKKKEPVSKEALSDEFSREQSFTQPRTITLDTKYEGAVTINIWTGYAVLVVSKTGTRKVLVGPHTCLLEYDENLEGVELSTGTPKRSEKSINTVYLRVLYNKISDVVNVESADFARAGITLSYRVNFEGDSEKWFNVENYVKFLTEHMRSIIRNAVKKHTIMDFYANGIDIIRDIVLGKAEEGSKRTGRFFEENGMRIYDVEVLNIKLNDAGIEELLVKAQQEQVKQTLKIESDKLNLNFTRESENISRQIAETKSETTRKNLDLKTEESARELELSLAGINRQIKEKETRLAANLEEQEKLSSINAADLKRNLDTEEQRLALSQKDLEQRLELLRGEVNAVVSKAQAVSPDLISALQAFGDKALAEKMAESMAPLAILGGNSVADVFTNLVKGTKLANVLEDLTGGGGGTSGPAGGAPVGGGASASPADGGEGLPGTPVKEL